MIGGACQSGEPFTARVYDASWWEKLEMKVEKISPSDSEDKATASLDGSLLCSSPSWPLVAIAKWNDDLFKVLKVEGAQPVKSLGLPGEASAASNGSGISCGDT